MSPLLAQAEPPLKPSSPLRAGEVGRLKPASPLRARNGCFECVFWLQRCCWFQRLLFRGEQWLRRFHVGLCQSQQWCLWFQCRHVAASCARKSSPCAACCGCEREKVRPANGKWPEIGVLWRAGRTFSRKSRRRGVLGEFFAEVPAEWDIGRVFSRVCTIGSVAGRTFSRKCGRVQLSVYPSFCLKGLMHDE